MDCGCVAFFDEVTVPVVYHCDRHSEVNVARLEEELSQESSRLTDANKHIKNQQDRLRKLEAQANGHRNDVKNRQQHWHAKNDALRADLDALLEAAEAAQEFLDGCGFDAEQSEMRDKLRAAIERARRGRT
jgi:hypothetical protein